jgi:hypothetical protein
VPTGDAAFTEYVPAQLRRELKGAQVEVTGPLTLVVDGRLQAKLGRVFTYCSGNAEGVREGVTRFHNSGLGAVPKSKDAVGIVLQRVCPSKLTADGPGADGARLWASW